MTSQPQGALHRQRLVAESFGTDAELYDRARPRYPAELVDRVIAASGGRDILDVGCGTGIAARLFASAGCDVLGVEPDPRMAEIARGSGIEVQVAKFEDWDAGGRLFDAVISAQAWHWVDPAAGAVKAASVLRPSGRLAVFWNIFDPPAELRAAFDGVYRRVLAGSPINDLWSLPTATARQVMSGTAVGGSAGGRVRPPRAVAVQLVAAVHAGGVAHGVPTLGGHADFPPGGPGGAAGRARRRHRPRGRHLCHALCHGRGHRRGRRQPIGPSAPRPLPERGTRAVEAAARPAAGRPGDAGASGADRRASAPPPGSRRPSRLRLCPQPVTVRVHLEKYRPVALEKKVERAVAQGQALREHRGRRDDGRGQFRLPDRHPVRRQPRVRGGDSLPTSNPCTRPST